MGRHNHYDVVAAYKSHLKDMVRRTELKSKNSKMLWFLSKHGFQSGASKTIETTGQREDGTKITHRDRLCARISGLQSAIELEKSFIESLQSTGQTEYEKFLQEEDGKTRPAYELWREHLQRPAYSENISEAMRSFAESSFKSNGENKINKGIDDTTDILSKIINSFQTITGAIAGGALALALPIEAVFTWPAFYVLNPGNNLFATTGCVVFTIALAGTGYLWALCLRNGFHNRIEKIAEAKTKIVTFKSRIWLSLSTILLGVGLALIVSGADLRSKIPQMSDWINAKASLETDRNSLFDHEALHLLQLNSPNDLQAKSYLTTRSTDLDASRQVMLTFGSKTLHSDEILALGVYAFIFLLGGLKTLTATDRFFEYHLLARTMSDINESKMRLAGFRDLNVAFYEARMKDLERSLDELRVELWLVAPNDPLARCPKDENGKASKNETPPQQAEAAKAVDASNGPGAQGDQEISETYGDLWVRERLRNYVRMYTGVRGSRLCGLWLSSVRDAMS